MQMEGMDSEIFRSLSKHDLEKMGANFISFGYAVNNLATLKVKDIVIVFQRISEDNYCRLISNS
jgi:hypothetical protein